MSLIKRLKKLNLKPADILVVTLKGSPTYEQLERTRNLFHTIPFLKNANIILVSEQVVIKKGKATAGKHGVYLNNLEYLEYLSKKQGEIDE